MASARDGGSGAKPRSGSAAGRGTVATAAGADHGPTSGRKGGRPAARAPNTGRHGIARPRSPAPGEPGETPITTPASEAHGEGTFRSDATPASAIGNETAFHPSWHSRRVVAFWACTFLVTTLVWWTFTGIHLRSLPAGNRLPGTLIYPLFWATMWTWSRVLRGTSLTISTTRLVYATRDGSTSVPWRDITGTGRRLGPGRWLLGTGLILRTPTGESPEWRWRLLSWRASPVRFIPLDQFGAGWREGELGRAIRRYAPALLATNGEV